MLVAGGGGLGGEKKSSYAGKSLGSRLENRVGSFTTFECYA